LEAKFDLCTEPWILLRRGVEVEALSLLGTLRDAHAYDALAGELPTQDAAILRILLAVLYAVFTRFDPEKGAFAEIGDGDVAVARWRALWALKRFPVGAVTRYLDRWKDRFWLFHADTPFLQTAGIRADERYKPVAQMVAHVPSREERRFFTERSGDAAQSLSFAEAARWLVHLQAWDYAGKKASVEGGSPDGRGGGTGWCGKLGLVYPTGKNLFETLMLNLVLADASGRPLRFGAPTWEDAREKEAAVAKRERIPQGYAELLTWRSRRVRLFPDAGGDRVIGVVSSYGDIFKKENTFIEQMSGWHMSAQGGKDHIPNTHVASRAFWRDLGALLPQSKDENPDGKRKRIRPGVLDWIARIDAIDGLVNLCAVGYEYGAMQAIVNELISDSVALNAKLLKALDAAWQKSILDLIADTEQAVGALGRLAADLDRAAGGDGTGAGNESKEQAYFALDEPFREWLVKIDPDNSSLPEARNVWKRTARRIVRKIGAAWIAKAGDVAFVGRNTEKAGHLRGYSVSASANMKFEAELNRIFGGIQKDGRC
jgi:CRISPR system Cascade subunit CasA